MAQIIFLRFIRTLFSQILILSYGKQKVHTTGRIFLPIGIIGFAQVKSGGGL